MKNVRTPQRGGDIFFDSHCSYIHDTMISLTHNVNNETTLLTRLSAGCKEEARNCVATASVNTLSVAGLCCWDCSRRLWDVRSRRLLGNTSLISACRVDTSSGEDMRDSKTASNASITNDSSFV